MNTDTNGSVFSSKDMEEFAKYFWRKHQDKESLSLEATVGGDLIEWIIGPDTKDHSVSDEEMKRNLLDKNGFDFDAFEFENEFSAKAILKAMEEYKTLQSTPEPINDVPEDWQDHLWDKISNWQSREVTMRDKSIYHRDSQKQKAEDSYQDIVDYVQSLIKK